MTSSSSYEVRLTKGGRDWLTLRRDALTPFEHRAEPLALRAAEAFAVAVRRPEGAAARLRLRLGDEVLAEAAAGAAALETDCRPWLYSEVGESCLVLEQEVEPEGDDEPRRFEALVEVGLDVEPRPEVARDYRLLTDEVAAVHEGLAQDLLHRAYLKRRLARGPAERLPPAVVLDRLRDLYARLEHAVAQIARQPSTLLGRTTRPGRYRGGDRLDAAAAASAARDPRARADAAGRVRALGRLRLRAPVLSGDLPEHRHAAEGVRQLARRAGRLAGHCERAAALYYREEERWGRAREGRASVFAREYRPRAEALEALAADAYRLAERFQDLLWQHAFLREAGPPRTPLGPTPAFLGRSAYREVYRLLVRARQPLGVLVEGDEVRVAYRGLARLYEYWCFLKAVAFLRDRLGPAQPWSSLALVDEDYRPDLAPGQQFRFTTADGLGVAVTYEPEVWPWRVALKHGDRYGATLTRDPLRPDVLVELRRAGAPPALLVLDAKSTDAFRWDEHRGMTDYARQVFEPATWRQPVRQVFLLHRDRGCLPLTNVPDYLRGRPAGRDAAVIGAVPCAPEADGATPPALAAVLERFLETYG